MARKYIKSHSNFVERTRHQLTNDGVIFERDITTIGGRDQFARGQVPIFRSGNFVITTSNDNSVYNKISDKPWQRNETGDIWTLDSLRPYEKDEKTSYDRKIVLKKDYHDLRDYAYFGSCSELMRGSINDILNTYPGELFVPYETLYVEKDGDGVQYTEEAAIQAEWPSGYIAVNNGIKGYYTSFENVESRMSDKCGVETFDVNGGNCQDADCSTSTTLSIEATSDAVEIFSPSLLSGDTLTADEAEGLMAGIPYTREFKYITDPQGNIVEVKSLSLIDNPFNINIHDTTLPKDANPLKYFAEGGVDNYVAYIKDSINDEWKIDKDHEYSIEIEDIIFDGIGEIENTDETFNVNGGNCPNDSCGTSLSMYIQAHSSSEKSGCIIDCIVPGKYIGKITLCFKKINYKFKTTPGLQFDDDGNPIPGCCDDKLVFPSAAANMEGKYNGDDTQIESLEIGDCKKRLEIYMFMGNNNEVKYLVEDKAVGGDLDFDDECISGSTIASGGVTNSFNADNFLVRIRPRPEIINEYFDNLDLFEKVLLNRDSDPIYTATFELLGENDDGNYTYTRQFTFPTTYGGWNLGSTTQAFTNYINRLSEVGEYYDSKYTDNMWRSMTHEAIKNFDWTYTRHYTPGEEEPFVEGGTKIQKIVRLYGREFDEIKNYIEAIDDINTITYDDINNIPDYFLTDKLNEQGWDVKLVHPLKLNEYINDSTAVPVDIHTFFPNKYDEDGNEICTKDAEIMNFFYDEKPGEEYQRNKITIRRSFNQDTATTVPYSCSNITTVKDTKYAKDNPDEAISKLEFSNTKMGPDNCLENGEIGTISAITVSGESVSKGYHTDCGEIIKIYCDENEYTPSDVNTEFIRRMFLNSNDIWRHKGTIEGMEMVLAMFGLRSKNRVYTDEKYFVNQKNRKNGEEEKEESGDTCLNLTDEGKTYYKNYQDNLYNLYDYEIKEYTMFTTREEDEWVPRKNMYKYDWINSTKLISYGSNRTGYIPYQGLPVSYREVEEGGEKKRYLYPHFDSYNIYDGNPYYQMNGGWMRKRPFMFDVNNNIVMEDYESDNRRDRSLFTETVKNIKCVDTIQELLSTPSLANGSGDICQVMDLSGRFAIIDGYMYTLYTEYSDSENPNDRGNSFFYATVSNNSLSVGNAFFTDYVIISNPYQPEYKQRIDLTDEYYNDKQIKIYILGNAEDGYDIDVYSKDMSISTFTVFENGQYMEGENFTNYFRINNIDYYNELSVLGWQQLRSDEYEYYRMSTITDYREGNNPHTGHMNYDNGHEYLTYFQRVFKTAMDEDLIDYRQYGEEDSEFIEEIGDLGFKNLIDDDDCEKDYDKYLREDNKCHFFGVIGSNPDVRSNMSCFDKRSTLDGDSYPITSVIRKSIIDDFNKTPVISGLTYGETYPERGEEGDYKDKPIDKVTDQIVNTKRMEIEFFIKNRDEYSAEWLAEVKYIDSVILPYLTQVIPSTVIWTVKYTTKDKSEWCSPEKKAC